MIFGTSQNQKNFKERTSQKFKDLKITKEQDQSKKTIFQKNFVVAEKAKFNEHAPKVQ